MGGFLAIAYAIEHPEHVASLMLIDSMPPTHEQLGPGLARMQARVDRLVAEGIIPAEMPQPEGDDCSASLAPAAPAYFADPRDPRMSSLRSGCSVAAGAAAALADGYDFRAGMAEFTMPVLVMMGAEDPFGVEWADELVAALTATKARRVVIPRCGHFPWIEAPDVFGAEMAAFLR